MALQAPIHNRPTIGMGGNIEVRHYAA